MVKNELKQLLNGESVYFRDRAPEPLLLPRIASRIAPEGLRATATAADILSRCWAPNGWPSIADATAEAIALRHTELNDQQLEELCVELRRLPLALIELDDAAGKRAETIYGSDAANRLRAGLGNPAFFLREAVSRIFDDADPPYTTDDLMVFIKDRTEFERPEFQRNLLAYFLPMAPAKHRQWMVPILVEVLGAYPDWSVAAGASRVAGILDQTAIEQVKASLKCNVPWGNHVCELLEGSAAASAFEEVTRALPYDDRLESLLASETALASLTDFVDGILEGWGGSSPPKMEVSRGMASSDWGDDLGDDWAEESGPEEAPPTASASRGFTPVETGDDLDETPLESSSRSEPKSPPPPAPASDPSPERMLQAQVLVNEDDFLTPVTQSFMRDTPHDVRLWIGPKKTGAISADKVFVDPTPDEQERQKGSMEIVITLAHGSDLQSKTVDLPIDRTKSSTKAVFSLQVDKKYVRADVWLQHKGRILQYFELNGPTREDPEDSISLTFQSAIRGIPVDSSGSDIGMAMVQKDDKYIVFGPNGLEKTDVSLKGSGDFIKSINSKLFSSTKRLVRKSVDNRGTSWVADHDEEAMNLLLEMARWGNALYDTLQDAGVLERISETIQFVNLDETDVVPVEYVYDRGYPKEGATLCEGFREAEDWNEIFAAGHCSCSNQPGVDSNTLCPMGFWSLSKIIERQSKAHGPSNTQSNTGLTEPSASTPGIPLSRYAVLAAAPNVKDEDVNSIKAMLEETYPDHYKFASNWEDWKTEIEEKSPKLLILLPHHGKATGGHLDFLEIGSPGIVPGDKLHTGRLKVDHVSSRLDEPGPIVLLLGCETAQAERLPYHTFARSFIAKKASIVVATQASVLGQHAAPVANEFVRQLLASTQTGGSFGKIMRDVRRKMFASGYLMSLALVSFGDSDWKLENNTTGDGNVSH